MKRMNLLQTYKPLAALLLIAAMSGSAFAHDDRDNGHDKDKGSSHHNNGGHGHGNGGHDHDNDPPPPPADPNAIIWNKVQSTVWWPKNNTVGDHWTAFNTPTNNK